MSEDLKYSPWEIGHAQVFACTSGIAHVIDTIEREFHDARKYRVTYVCCRKCTAEMARRHRLLSAK